MVLTLVLIPYIMAHNGRKTPNGEAASKNNIRESFINIYQVKISNNYFLLLNIV